MKRLVIIGASGHGKVAADIAVQVGYDQVVFLDDNEEVKSCGSSPVVGKSGDIGMYDCDVFVAIGNATVRSKLLGNIPEEQIATLIHPRAVIARDTKIGKGSVVMAGCVVNAGSVIGRGCIINTGATVDHDCVIGDYAHVSVGTHLAGTVTIGEETWIGAGAVVSNNLTVAPGCTVGAGAVVIKDITEKGTYVGVPARKIK